MDKTEYLKKLNAANDAGDLETLTRLLKDHQNRVSKREAKFYGKITFKQLAELILRKFVSNDMNREEELDGKKAYKNKFSHLVRYLDSTSRKSHLQLSFVPQISNETLFISDDGTMMALCFGRYRYSKMLTGNEISEILDEIKEVYDLDGSETFYTALRGFLDSLTDEQMEHLYSLTDLILLTKMQEYYGSTTINYEVNLLTTIQHIKDQQNANLQPNPWMSHNFYKAPVKALRAYKETFCGDYLQTEVFPKIDGIGCNPNQKEYSLFRTYCHQAKRAKMEIPLYTTKSALMEVEKFDHILDYNKYFLHHAKHEDEELGQFWYDAYENLVLNTKQSDMIDHVRLVEIIIKGEWDAIRRKISEVIEQKNVRCGAILDLNPYKDDFGMYITFVVLALHKLHPESFSRSSEEENIRSIKKYLISEIVKNFDREVAHPDKEGEVINVMDLFIQGQHQNWASRFTYIWEPAIKRVHTMMTTKVRGEKVFDREIERQKDIIRKLRQDNGWGSIYLCYSHQDDELVKLDFNDTTKTMAGLHCVARSNEGTAKDGVIWGLRKDNEDSWKYSDLTKRFTRPSDYWVSLGNRNEAMLELQKDSLTSDQKKSIRKFITLCEEIGLRGIEYLTKN